MPNFLILFFSQHFLLHLVNCCYLLYSLIIATKNSKQLSLLESKPSNHRRDLIFEISDIIHYSYSHILDSQNMEKHTILTSSVLFLSCCFLGFMILFNKEKMGLGLTWRFCIFAFQHLYTLAILFYHSRA